MTLRDAKRKARGRLRRNKKYRHQAEPKSTRRQKAARRVRFWRKRLAYLKRKLAVRRAENRGRGVSKVVGFASWGVANEPQIHYRQSRPIDGLNVPEKLPLYTDCSGFATDCYHWAGAPDPNGNGWNGEGYTGTMLAHCQHISQAEAKAGDLIVYGNYPGEHVVILEHTTSDPTVISHGQEAGPLRTTHSVEVASHGFAPSYFLRAV